MILIQNTLYGPSVIICFEDLLIIDTDHTGAETPTAESLVFHVFVFFSRALIVGYEFHHFEKIQVAFSYNDDLRILHLVL